jgi:hypothetical protein
LDLQKSLLSLRELAAGHETYSGVPVQNTTCQFFVRVFPSSKMQDDDTTSQPMLFTIGAVMIFSFTSLIFVVYDWLVEKRQSALMTTAVQSSAIVSSLFPSSVRDRLFHTDEAKESNGTAIVSNTAAKNSAPIADLYPNTTVMFADM